MKIIICIHALDLAETVTGKVAGNISSMYSMIRQKTSDIQETFESLTSGTNLTDKQKSLGTMSTLSSNSTSDENLSMRSAKTTSENKSTLSRVDSTESDSLQSADNSSHTKNEKSQPDDTSINDENIDKEEQLIYLVTNVLYTVLWHGIENNLAINSGDSWKERGQVIACINLLGLNNELYCSHLTLRLRIFELGVQASLMDLADTNAYNHVHQENAAQLLRMVYDLVVLDPNEDELKKCSAKLLDGVLALMGKH